MDKQEQHSTMDNKIIWVAGIPRAGSMWTYNVSRGLLRANGNDVQPQFVPKSDKEVFELATQALQDAEPEKIYTFKTHSRIRPEFQGSSYITVVRDIRDALVSWMRFMHSDFDTALNAAKDMTTTIDHYKKFPRKIILHIDYENIISAPNKVCTEIVKFLSLNVADTDIKSIIDMHSKNSVARRIERKEQDITKYFQDNATVPEDDVIRNFDNSLRAYDTETGFQSGHVTSYRGGDWKKTLTQNQQERMYDVLGDWLEKNGYTE